MKHKPTAFIVLGLLSGMAVAQSNVTIFGTVEVALRNVKNDGRDARRIMGSDGLGNSKLGFRGSEDLGGGLFADFWLEGQVRPDDGNSTGFSFRRKSTVSLRSGAWGELRFGRDYTPTFLSIAGFFDPFGHNGIGLSNNVDPFGGTLTTYTRSDNTISYLSPRVSGFSGQITIAPGEGNPNARYIGGRIDYGQGPLDVRASLGRQDVNRGLPNAGKFETRSVGARYNLGFASLRGLYVYEKLDSPVPATPVGTFKHWMIGAVIPLGVSEIRASYNRGTMDGGNGASQWALGYVYNLSKLTALYATTSTMSNRGTFAQSIDYGIPNGQTPVTAGGKSRGVEAGLSVSF